MVRQPRTRARRLTVVSEFIPLSVPNISGNEWEYVKDCLDTAWVSSVGSYVSRFEELTAERVGCRFAVALSSGTAALHLGLVLSGVGEGDEVVVPSLTFIASANVVRYVGAWPVLVDCDPQFYQMDPRSLRRFLSEECDSQLRNRNTGRTVRAILPVHVLGHPCDIDEMRSIAAKYGLRVVEDAAEALGSRYKDAPVGAGTALSCFSFNGNKILTTGGGGMLVTDDEDLANRARYLSTQAKDDELGYVHGEVGYNYRLTNVQAAIGCAQLEQLDRFVERKRQVAHRYRDALGDIKGVVHMPEARWADSTFWLYTIRLDPEVTGVTPDTVIGMLASELIQARPLWQPMHLSPVYQGSFHMPCPNAEAVHATAISIPCSTNITDEEQNRVIRTIRRILGK